MNILYQDARFTVCVKEAGMLAEDSAAKESTLPAALRREAAARGEEKRSVFTVHRLDREVGGVTVVAATKQTAAALTRSLQEKRFVKEYLAVIEGVPEENEGVFCDLLLRDASRGKTYVVDRPRRGVRDASLSYTVLATADWEGKPASLVRIRLFTGRTHQIRVQFASRKLPLFGDGRYGSRIRRDSLGRRELALFAYALAFPDPKTGTMRSFSHLPDRTQFPYSLFDEAAFLRALSPWECPMPRSFCEN